MSLITIEHLTKSYTERLLFDDTAFSINEGEKVGLIGINGTGKSTLLKIVAGLEEPDDGSVVRRRNLYVRYLPQIPVFTAGDTVLDAIVRDNQDEPHFSSREEIEASAKNILTRLGIYDFDEKVGASVRRPEKTCGADQCAALHGRPSDPGRADQPLRQ
mgnify:CR=1 FL=1